MLSTVSLYTFWIFTFKNWSSASFPWTVSLSVGWFCSVYWQIFTATWLFYWCLFLQGSKFISKFVSFFKTVKNFMPTGRHSILIYFLRWRVNIDRKKIFVRCQALSPKNKNRVFKKRFKSFRGTLVRWNDNTKYQRSMQNFFWRKRSL